MFKNKKYSHETKLYKAMNKYGYANFKIELVEQVDDYKLNEREQYWIATYDTINNGYNISPGGDGGPLFAGHKHSEATKQKISTRCSKLKWFTNGIQDVMREVCPDGYRPGRTNLDVSGCNNPMYGKIPKNKGIPMSDESKEKLKESLLKLNKTRKMVWYTNDIDEIAINELSNEAVPDGYHRGRLKRKTKVKCPVKIADLLTGYTYIFDSLDEASRATGLSFVTIKKSCESHKAVKYDKFMCEYIKDE